MTGQDVTEMVKQHTNRARGLSDRIGQLNKTRKNIGPKGETGLPGDKGIKGDTGEEGVKGVKGISRF